MNFKVGDRVVINKNGPYVYTTQGCTGTVIQAYRHTVYIEWDNERELQRRSGANPKHWPIDVNYIDLEETSQDKTLSKVEKRIKKLWNNSNWVKKNPQMAY